MLVSHYIVDILCVHLVYPNKLESGGRCTITQQPSNPQNNAEKAGLFRQRDMPRWLYRRRNLPKGKPSPANNGIRPFAPWRKPCEREGGWFFLSPRWGFAARVSPPHDIGSSFQDLDGLGNPEIEDSTESKGDPMRGGWCLPSP